MKAFLWKALIISMECSGKKKLSKDRVQYEGQGLNRVISPASLPEEVRENWTPT